MIHIPPLILDLSIILTSAGVVTLLFRKLKQPVVLGYILAGFIVGPGFPILPSISDQHSIQIWAEVGVIFLLFSLGLEFSFRKLARVGAASGITALVEVGGMLAIGYLTGKFLGWKTMDSIFLGGILSISSTTIIYRAFEELNIKSRKFAHLVFGILIVEDLVAVLLLVLLSTVAISKQFEGVEMALSLGKLSFFLILWFVLGISVVPTVLKKIRVYSNNETLLVASIALCLAMVVLASKAGFSSALGAFIMGSILAETTEAERIEHLIRPVRDLFSAVFFVSVGMLINPNILSDNFWPIIVVTLVTILGKTGTTIIGALLAGQPIRHAVQSGFSLAQIGEFSFIIATLGLTLKVTSPFLYPIAVTVSAITTFTTPYFIRMADKAALFIEGKIPKATHAALLRYASTIDSVSTTTDWKEVMKSLTAIVALNGVIVIAIFVSGHQFLTPFVEGRIDNRVVSSLFCFFLILIVGSPFLWALAFGRPQGRSMLELWAQQRIRGPLLGIQLLRFLAASALIGFLLSQYTSFLLGLTVPLVLFIFTIFALSADGLQAVYLWFENHFLQNLRGREASGLEKEETPVLLPWEAHIAHFVVSPDSVAVGKTLGELSVRERFGVTIAMIERGRMSITAPNQKEHLYPFDKLSVIGSDEELDKFKIFVEGDERAQADRRRAPSDYSLQKITLQAGSPYIGVSIRDTGIREKTRGLIVGIERRGDRIVNPDSSTILKANDQLWIVGETNRIRRL